MRNQEYICKVTASPSIWACRSSSIRSTRMRSCTVLRERFATNGFFASSDSRNRPLAETAFAHVLLQTMALGKNQGAGASQAGNVAPCGYLRGHQTQRAVATIPGADNANGHDQRLAPGSTASICQRAVGSHSLSGYGPVISVNRPVRIRMPGGVGAGGATPKLPDWMTSY